MRPGLKQPLQLAARSGRRIEGLKKYPRLRRRRDAGLMGAVKADSAACDGDGAGHAAERERARGQARPRQHGSPCHPHATTIPLNPRPASVFFSPTFAGHGVGSEARPPPPRATAIPALWTRFGTLVDAISASTGAILWSYTPQAPQQSGDLALQAAANGTVYIRDGSANHQIEALNATSGALLWT